MGCLITHTGVLCSDDTLQGSYLWEEGHFTGVLLEDEAL